MARLNSTVLQETVSSEWLAKTYSEYMYACADDQIELNNLISEACDDATLNTAIEEYRSVFDMNIDIVNDEMAAFAIQNGATIEDIQSRNSIWSQIMAGYNPSTAVSNALNNIITKFDNSWSSTSDLLDDIRDQAVICDDHIAEQMDIQSIINRLSDGVLTTLNLPQGYRIPLQEGFVSLKDLTSNLITFSNLNHYAFDIASCDSLGRSLQDLTLTSSDVIEQLKESASSCIAWAQGFASCSLDNVTDRITNFSENVKTAFSTAYTESKQVFNNVRAMLSSATCTIENFISQATQQLGIFKLADEGITVDRTDVSQYTGASPYSGLNLHTAKGVFSAAVDVISGAAKAVWNGLVRLVKKGVSKIKPTVTALVGYPLDLKVINDKSDTYQVSDLCYNCDEARVEVPFEPLTANNLYRHLNSKYLNKTLSFDSYFSTVVIVVKSVSKTSHDTRTWIQITYSYQIKPKCMNWRALVNADLITKTSDALLLNTSTVGAITSYTNKLKAFVNSGNMYFGDPSNVDVTEVDTAAGFNCGMMCTVQALINQMYELYQQTDALNGWRGIISQVGHSSNILYDWSSASWTDTYLEAIKWQTTVASREVTNKEYLKICSGYFEGGETFHGGWVPYDNNGQFQMYHGIANLDAAGIASLMLGLFIIQQNDRLHNPGDFLFLPYSADTFSFGDPRFRVQVDSENASIVNAFYNALVVLSVIAITVLIGAKIARTITRARYKYWTATKGWLDNKIWNDPSGLTRKEWRTYLYAEKKLSKINLWSTGTATNNVVSSSDFASNIYDKLIGTTTAVPVSDPRYVTEYLVKIHNVIV